MTEGNNRLSRRTFVGGFLSVAAGCRLLGSDGEINWLPGPAENRHKLPTLPELMYGVNQYSVGLPKNGATGWPLKLGAIKYLKQEIGLNTVRFPVYPREVGIDGVLLTHWKPGETFDEEKADREWKFDWRSLDAVMDMLLEAEVTPHASPSIEDGKTVYSKLWPRLYHPENAKRCLWFTCKVVSHLQEKYGDQVAYSWYENWWWISTEPPENMGWLLPSLVRDELSALYKGDIAALNKNWRTNCSSFEQVPIPNTVKKQDIKISGAARTLGGGNLDLLSPRQGYDYRLALDRLYLRNLQATSEALKKISPGALWCGPCGCNEMGGLYDTRSVRSVRMNASLMTLAQGSDVLFIDNYGPPSVLKANYRTAAKVAHDYGKKIFVAEISGRQPEAFPAIADVGGASRGALIWAGIEAHDNTGYGILSFSGAPIVERFMAAKRLGESIHGQPNHFTSYQPGRLLVYIPLEIWSYSVLETNYVDAYMRLFETIPAEDIEPVLTGELQNVPKGTPLFVFDEVLPRHAIEELNRRGNQVVCPHRDFIDENGEKLARTAPAGNFFDELLKLSDGKAVYDAFRFAIDKKSTLTYPEFGAEACGSSELAKENLVIKGRPNQRVNAIGGSVFEGITFATKPQREYVAVKLQKAQPLSSAYVDFYQGNGQTITPSRLPDVIQILVSDDGKEYRQVASAGTKAGKFYYSIDFSSTSAKFVQFDFGYNGAGEGLKILKVGAY